MRILTEPKNAITRQFQKFLQLDKVELDFTPGAIEAAAELALNRKTGARALRSIVEESLLEVMFDIPERTDVRKCIITEETIRSGRAPLLLTKAEIDRGVDENQLLRGCSSAPAPSRVNGIGGFGGRNLAELSGSVGIWSFALQRMAARDEIAAARQFEELRFPALWIPESLGSKDVLAHSALLLGGTRQGRARNGDRQHPRARPDGHGQRRPRAGRGVSGSVRARHRRLPRADRPDARRRLRQSARADERLPRRHGRGAVRRTRARAAGAACAGRARAKDARARRRSAPTARIPYFVPVEHTSDARASTSAPTPAWRRRSRPS